MISPDTRRRIAAILPRLASPHDGEIVAAAKGLLRTLTGAGHDLNDLADLVAPTDARACAPAGTRDWHQMAVWCVKYGAGVLNDQELKFVDDLAARPPRQLSPRQEAWLRLIESRLSMRRSA